LFRRTKIIVMTLDLDLFTVLIIAVCALAIAGGLLLVSWLQSPNLRALGLWAMSFAGNAIGFALVAARGNIPDIWSILIAGAVLAASHGIMWTGVRSFEGRSTSVPLMLAGTLVWLVACQFEAFYDSQSARFALMSAIVVTYSVLSAVEFWRGRDEGLMRWLIIALLLGHAMMFLIRIPFGGSVPLPIHPGVHINWLTFIFFETIFYAFCLAYMLGSMARERIAVRYKQASLTDPLTGVANRRDFLERCEALLRRTAFEHRPSTLLLFDVDNFKSVNDTYGHHVGDQVLLEFCRVAESVLRPNDIFGRVGGEEFGCLIPYASLNEGRDIAERIRARSEAALFNVTENTIGVTVSAGVAVSGGPDRDFTALMMAADRALYRAKANGRNRVEWAPVGAVAPA
jgi:diguanylate cyclase (GGDEF)-like protein